MRNNHNFFKAKIITDARNCFEDKNETKIDWTVIKKFLKILSVFLIIFTLILFTCFGCFFVLNDPTSLAAQTVTLSSEGATNEKYSDYIGEYQLAGEIKGYNWYRHKDRQDRFLKYNNQGNI